MRQQFRKAGSYALRMREAVQDRPEPWMLARGIAAP